MQRIGCLAAHDNDSFNITFMSLELHDESWSEKFSREEVHMADTCPDTSAFYRSLWAEVKISVPQPNQRHVLQNLDYELTPVATEGWTRVFYQEELELLRRMEKIPGVAINYARLKRIK